MIAVTGATGYIGRTLVAYLAARGHAVLAVTRREPPAEHAGDRVRWLAVADGAPTAADLAGCEAVVHLAGRAHTRVAMQEGRDLFDEANRGLALRTADAARAAGVRRFVFVSTVGVHGNWSAAPVTPDSPIQLDTPYARSKWRAEQELRQRHGAGPMQLCIVRPPMVYGPGCPGNFARLVKLVATGFPLPFGAVDGVRSFIQVDNLASFLERCALHPAATGVFVPADGSDWVVAELVRDIAAALGRPARLLPIPAWMLRAGAGVAGIRREMDSLTRPLRVDDTGARATLEWVPAVAAATALRQAARSHAA